LPGPPQIRTLKQRYEDKITVDVADLIYPLVGNNTHYILERMGMKNSLQEERLQWEIAGKTVSGQLDHYDIDKILWDYKVTTRFVLIDGVKPEWEAQSNINSWLLENHNFEVKEAKICAIFRDWSKIQAARNKDYPKHQVAVLPVTLWHFNDVESYIKERIKLHELAESLPDSELPECTPEERWAKPTTWAVKKEGRKTAVRVLGSRKDAEQYMKEKDLDAKHSIEKRPGESTRCEYYCDVKDYCHQYNHKILITRGTGNKSIRNGKGLTTCRGSSGACP
jgi:hypothetical protein